MGKSYNPYKKKPGIIILAYHSISNGQYSVDISPSLFEQHMKWIQSNYKVVSLTEALSYNRLEEDCIVITFDDGYKDYMTSAYPILHKYNIPSTVYVITDSVSTQKPFNFKAGEGKASLTIHDIEKLRDEKLVNIGAHTHTHLNLTQLGIDECRYELQTSYTILKDILKREDIDFCYPWALYNASVEKIVREYYSTAVIGRGRKNTFPYNKFQLMRIPVKQEKFAYFKERVTGNLYLEGLLRDARDLFRR